SHPRAIDAREQGHLILGMPWGMEDLKLIFLPFENLPMPKSPIDLDRFAQRAAQVVSTRILKNVHHILVTPNLGPVVPDQVWEAVHMIIVHVAGHYHIHRLEAIARLELGKGMFHKAHAIVNGSRGDIRQDEILATGAVIHE